MKYYLEGKFDAFEEKPINIKFSGNIKIFEISVSKHGNYHNFIDAEELANDFLSKIIEARDYCLNSGDETSVEEDNFQNVTQKLKILIKH